VSDAKHPENEGKVFLFRYGKKIFDKIMESMQPAFPDDVAVNPFDFWEGANFKLKIRKVDGYWNYDKSEFDSPTAIFKEESAIESLWKTQYPLNEFTGESNFKSYDELKIRLDTVLSGKTTVGNVTDSIEEETVAVPRVDTTPSEAPKVATSVDSEDQDSMDYFNKLANA
jgi:hypothetical protein